jgi:hypothetical protein
MAFYGDAKRVRLSDKPSQYEKLHKPGQKPPAPGIYKCQTCLYEDVINRECETLPPCSNCKINKNEHWKLLVKASDK